MTKTLKGLSISNPINPVVGQMFGRSLAGPIVATTWISSSPQKAIVLLVVFCFVWLFGRNVDGVCVVGGKTK